jgi:hypothetical protein
MLQILRRCDNYHRGPEPFKGFAKNLVIKGRFETLFPTLPRASKIVFPQQFMGLD